MSAGQPPVFLGTDVAGLVYQQNRDAVIDAVGLVQPGVVEDAVGEDQRSPVGGAHQEVQECGIHGGQGVTGTGAAGTSATGGAPTDMPGIAGLLAPGIWPAPITALLAFCWDCACWRISIWPLSLDW